MWSFSHALLTFLLFVLTFIHPCGWAEAIAGEPHLLNDNCPMTAITLNIQDRKALRADAHHLNPVVMVGSDGLTAAVKREVDAALNAHGLIKIRIFSDDRAAREAMLVELTHEFNAAPIQHIGKLLVIWREKLEPVKAVNEDRMRGPRDMKVMKYSKRGGQRPEVRTLRVLGNERLTFGGKVKRVQPKLKSVKKTQLG
jgi:RNA-binding protein